MTPHRLDPTAAHDAASRFGKLVAQGVVEPSDCIAHIIEAAVKAGYSGNRSGLRTRLSHALLDSAAAWTSRSTLAERDIRKALGPLFNQYLSPEAIIESAHRKNNDHGSPLLSHEVRAVVDEEATWWVRMNTKRRRHAR